MTFPFTAGAQLGLGLIGIGRAWGHVPSAPPAEADALRFLDFACQSGIRYFDCAPSYGSAEERLGKFLRSLPGADRALLSIATKFGEHWDEAKGEPFVDHSFDALRTSLLRSLDRLGPVDVLQLHKTTPAVLRSDALRRAWEFARSVGVRVIGASVSDLESAAIAGADAGQDMMQFPLNSENTTFQPVATAAHAAGKWVAVNRPYAMGKLLYQSVGDAGALRVSAFSFVLERVSRGVILSGTHSCAHLAENITAFREANRAAGRGARG